MQIPSHRETATDIIYVLKATTRRFGFRAALVVRADKLCRPMI